MLTIDFLNVGDGDAILVRERYAGRPDFVVLVDTGRPDVEFSQGCLRRAAISHLMKLQLDHIDLMILTHLHFDHIGGALRILRNIPVKRLLVGYLPPEHARWIIPPSFETKTVAGLCEALNLLLDIVACAREGGSEVAVVESGVLPLTGALYAEITTADEQLLARQKDLFDALYRGESPDNQQIYDVSKERNCSSMIMRLCYAQRSVLLTGDSYAEYWENRDGQTCDILKLPHHGDEKSMTQQLLQKLAPTYAVISCQHDEGSHKDRPAACVIALLQQFGVYTVCTENREMPGLASVTHERVTFCIHGSGQIDAPHPC